MKYGEIDARLRINELDRKYGLRGMFEGFKFGGAKSYPCEYRVKEKAFYFSNYYFSKEDEQEYLDNSILKAYADYMVSVHYENKHEYTLEECLEELGYDADLQLKNPDEEVKEVVKIDAEEVLANIQIKNDEYNKTLDEIKVGYKAYHQRYLEGVIEEITGEGLERNVKVKFENEEKVFKLKWLKEHCMIYEHSRPVKVEVVEVKATKNISIGDEINHPVYGHGIVLNIDGEEAVLEFDDEKAISKVTEIFVPEKEKFKDKALKLKESKVKDINGEYVLIQYPEQKILEEMFNDYHTVKLVHKDQVKKFIKVLNTKWVEENC